MKKFIAIVAALLAGIAVPRGHAQVSVIGELSQDREAEPGSTYSGSIIVKNDSHEPQDAKIYQTDYLFFSNGTNRYGEPGSHTRSNAKWVTFSPSFVTLPPMATSTITYTVAVPAGADTLTGSYWSMLMVEGIPKGSPESSGIRDRKAEMGIMQTIRYGIQIATHIAKTGTRSVQFKDPRLTADEGGKRVFQVDVENTGTLWIRPDVTLEVFDAQGQSRGKFPGVKYRIYPGTSVRETFDLTGLPAGSYKLLVVIDAGDDDMFGAQYSVTF